jgi:TonB family protein
MKKYTFLLIFLLTLQLSGFSQANVGDEEDKDQIFTSVEEVPEFPGGETALFKFLGDNIKYPDAERKQGISGTVYVSFIVDKKGKVKDVKLVRGVKGGAALDAEALRVIGIMPDWKPGKQAGKEVMVQYNFPVKFLLN